MNWTVIDGTVVPCLIDISDFILIGISFDSILMIS